METNVASITQQFTELRNVLEAKHGEFVKLVEKANTEIATQGKVSEETKTLLAEVGKKAADLDQRLAHVERIALKPVDQRDGPLGGDSPGELMTKSQSFKDLIEGRTTRARVNVNNLILSSTAPNVPVGSAYIPPQFAPFLPGPALPVTVRSLIPTGRTNSNLIEYVRESGFTNAAAIVAEGAQKPESSLLFALVSSPVVTIAHFIQASKQVLADAPMLESYINGRLIYGLKRVEENEIINGDGTAGHLSGLMHNAVAASAAPPGDATAVDAVGLAAAQIMNAGYTPNGVIMNPTDWMGLMLAKDSLGRYIYGNPTGMSPTPIWGMKAVPSYAMAAGSFLVGDFIVAAQIWDREDANVVASTEDRDNFIKNLVTLLAEERMGLAVYVPAALVKGTVPAGGGAVALGENGNGRRAR